MKKVISLILTIMMLLSMMAGMDFSAYANDFTEVRTVADLYKIRYNLDGNYVLMNDIDLTSATSENGTWSFDHHGWNPIGSSNIYSNQEPFTGIFDGCGHKIIGLTMTPYRPAGAKETYVGLFSNNQGTIKNLVIENLNIEFTAPCYADGSFIDFYHSYAGCIAAINSGNILNCKSKNSTITFYSDLETALSVSGETDIGGIVAINDGSISYCYSDILISRRKKTDNCKFNYTRAGGITKHNKGSIYCCWSTPSFENIRDDCWGGFTEYNFGGKIDNSYCNKGIVRESSGNVYNCYSTSVDRTIGGSATACYFLSNGLTQTGCTPLNEEQMKMDFMYQGFDFDNVWYIDENSDYPYPQLRIPNTKTVEKITIKKQPKKTVYVTNEAIEAAEGVLNVKYIDGTFEDVPMKDNMLSGYDMATAGTQTVTVTYEDKTATFDILVKDEANIDSLVIQSQPNKTTFVKGTKFDFTGCVARVNYADATYDDINITADMTSGGDINTVGTQTISYSVGGKTATFDVEVVPVAIDRISIASAPDKIDYLPDEELDTTGLVVKAEYNNGKTTEITNYTLSGFGDTNEVNPITVSYDGKETTFNVTIHTPDEEWTIVKEADCTVQGEKVKYCKTCGKVIVKSVEEPKGHNPVTDNAVDATCTKTGLTEGSHCSVCGTVLTAQQVINAKGHSYTSSITTTATCTNKGIRTYTCSTCGDTYTTELEMTAHTPVADKAIAATCTASGLTAGSHCSVCGTVITAQEVINAKGHKYNTVVTAPTCKDQGYTTYTCSVCGDSYKSDYTAVTDNHDYRGTVTTPATCTTTGIKTFTCALCGDSYTETIDKIAHTPETDAAVAPTCNAAGLTEGSHCSVCGAVITAQEVINATGHSYASAVTAPTCKDQGYTTYTCAVCGDSYKDSFTDTIDEHDYKAAVTTPATCTTTGIKTYTCTICGDKYTEDIPMKAHTPVTDSAVAATCTKAGLTEGSHCSACGTIITAQEVVDAKGHNYTSVITAPTCEKRGYTTYTCSVCGDSYKADFTDTTDNHDYNGVVTTPATCSRTGVKTYTCTICGDKYTEDIPMKEHTPVTDSAVSATCTKAGKTEGSHCSACGTTIVEQSVIPAIGHNYETSVTAPTCRDQGYTTYTCTVCGDTYRADYVNTIGAHDYRAATTKLPSCVSSGVKTYTCSICGDKYTETIPKLAHTPADAVTENAIEATCASTGSYDTVVYCADCGAELSRETIVTDKTAHNVVTDAPVAATCSRTGLTEGSHCSFCGEIFVAQEVVPMKAHTIVADKAVAPTFTAAGKTAGSHCSVCKKVIVAQKAVAKLGAPAITKLVAAKKKFTVTWKAVGGVDGYEVQYSLKKNMSGAKLVAVGGAKSYTRAISGLKAKKVYYVRIRAYKTVNGKKLYSAWTPVKNIKTK